MRDEAPPVGRLEQSAKLGFDVTREAVVLNRGRIVQLSECRAARQPGVPASLVAAT